MPSLFPRPPPKCWWKCGSTVFKKSSVVSCSAMPPLFKCAECGKFQTGLVNFAISPSTGWSVLTKDGYFTGILHCYTCGTEINDFDPENLPNGWRVDVEETTDPLGNPMWKHYAYCGCTSTVRKYM